MTTPNERCPYCGHGKMVRCQGFNYCDSCGERFRHGTGQAPASEQSEAMNKTEYPPTPELDKMKSVKPRSQTIGAFLEWLEQEGMEVCNINLPNYELPYTPIGLSIEKLLARYFEIDLDKCEQERCAILEHIRP